VFQSKSGSYDTASLILFLKDLKRHFRGQKVILIWDGLPAHRSATMREYIEKQKAWLSVERLPGYAPELNPVECLWGNIKGQEMANLCVDGFGEIGGVVAAGMARIKKQKNLLFSFLKHTKLYF
jgi:putative transposase